MIQAPSRPSQVVRNFVVFHHHVVPLSRSLFLFVVLQDGLYVQFEEREVGVAVVSLVFALRGHIVLEYTRRLGVVAIEAVQNRVDVLWPLGGKVERDAHSCVCV